MSSISHDDSPKNPTGAVRSRQLAAAKLAGALYLIQMAAGVFGEVVVRSRLIVRNDPRATAENIIASEHLFRLSIVGDLITCVTVLILVWALYVVLRPVQRNVALLGAMFRLVELAVLALATVNSLAVLQLLNGDNYLKALEPAQRQALATFAFGIQGATMNVGFIFLGLGSMAFAYGLLKSGYVPKAIAGWGIFASVLLALGTMAILAFPELGRFGMAHMMPMGLYEVGLGLWLLLKGIDTTSGSSKADNL